MENTPKKIANLQVKIVKNCSEKEKEIIEGYWKFEGTDFANTPKQLRDKYEISQPELNRIIKNSKLSYFKYCNSCDSYENLEATSIANFFETTRINVKRIKIKAFKCTYCESIEFEKKQLEEQKANKKFEQKFEQAIELKKWNNLNRLEREILCNCLEMKFSQLGKKYGALHGKEFYIKMIKALEKIAEENLINLVRDPRRNNYISDYHYLPRLADFKDEIKPPKKVTSSYVETNNVTNELKFKLNVNENQHHPNSPQHTCIVKFKETIVIQPDVEYIASLWNRANENLYLTLTPLENLEKTAKTKSISQQPISIQQGIADFLNRLGKDF
jgi:hypothetical protein